ncbi:sulfite exporter TauE/SafE family protein [Massilia glaciei]|uniref:Sulfite exporter TauE/SafE family protein n=1 Tax=Massilia glaciei TaxID=1524097 RepID=A0A2U2I4W4_9BURK|nr:sulfite exporter TauE/SafE family protein [Massilia glaciei]PWF54796.1 sulfite exporter TauE/SafE family protein [Massilia glaciei]
MDGINLLPVFLVGLAGSVHCVGMCGGIVSAFSMAAAERPAFPVPVITLKRPPVSAGVVRVAAYNTGRLASYATAGAIAGGLAGGVRLLADLSAWQAAAYWITSAVLILQGLYLMGGWAGLGRIERFGEALWRRLRPLTARIMPLDSPGKFMALGLLWGWLPCAMVYSVLVTAMLAGSAAGGASVMLAFGLGTLPMLLLMGLGGMHLAPGPHRQKLRAAAGVLVLAFGVAGIARAAGGLPTGWFDTMCRSMGVA